jgi:WS/DGAT/MGAT family acyltransferase
MDIAAILLDATSEPEPLTADDWTPRPAPGTREIASEELAGLLHRPAGLLHSLASIARHPREALAAAVEDAAGLGALARMGSHLAPSNPLNVRIGPNRSLGVARASLDDFRAVKARHGGTVNDVVLAVVAGALRGWLLHRGFAVDGLSLDAMVPVSIRGRNDGALGNQVATIIAPLPLDEPDPIARLRTIRDATVKAKHSHQVTGTDLLLRLSGVVPSALTAQVAKVQNAQRFFNLSVTNIPGPAEPLYLLGHRLRDIFPFTPLAGNMALIVAVVSYCGSMEFGLTVDAETIADHDVLVAELERSIAELCEHV